MVCIVHSGTGQSCFCTWSPYELCPLPMMSPLCPLHLCLSLVSLTITHINNDVADVDVTLMKKPCKVLYRSCSNRGEIYSKTLFFSDCITIVFLGRGGVMEMYIWINKHIEYILPVESSLAAVSPSLLRQNQPLMSLLGSLSQMIPACTITACCHWFISLTPTKPVTCQSTRNRLWARPLH